MAYPYKWYKHVASVRRIRNSTTTTATNFSPFKVLTGIEMENIEDLQIRQLLETEQTALAIDHKKSYEMWRRQAF